MFGKIRMLMTTLFLIGLLSGCGGSEDIVGRWELEFGNSGNAFEFYANGTGAHFTSTDPFNLTASVFTYTYDSKSGILNVVPLGEPTMRTITYQVSFESKDKISIEERGFIMPGFIRKPLPELPPGARARIGGLMLGKDFTFIDASRLKHGWEEDYKTLEGRNVEMPSSANVEKWLVTLQIDGNTSLYILGEGDDYRWKVVNVIKLPQNVPNDVQAAVDSVSPEAIILSAEKSEKSVNGSTAWCIVYHQKDGGIARILVGEGWNVLNVPEATFDDLGCTDWNN